MLTLALHELRANSIKYGALSTEGGRVDIHWETRHQGQNGFHLKWVETGVSIQELPRSKGFGSVLLLKIFPAEFQGVATFDYTPGQLTYSMRGTLSAT